jgi:hypothetical protein
MLASKSKLPYVNNITIQMYCGGKVVNIEEELDIEWVDLIKEALDLGLTVNEIMDFLKQS